VSDRDFVRNLNALVSTRTRRELNQLEPRGALKGKRVSAAYREPVRQGGGGLASPLTEQSYALREFHDSQYLFTSDGVFVWEFGPPKKLVLTDANGDTHPINLASPE
jgi:hypothetical protein